MIFSTEALFGDECEEDVQCQRTDQFSECRVDLRSYKECVCRYQYEMRHIPGLKISRICYASKE